MHPLIIIIRQYPLLPPIPVTTAQPVPSILALSLLLFLLGAAKTAFTPVTLTLVQQSRPLTIPKPILPMAVYRRQALVLQALYTTLTRVTTRFLLRLRFPFLRRPLASLWPATFLHIIPPPLSQFSLALVIFYTCRRQLRP